MIFYFRYEKARLDRQRVAEAAKGMGRPKVGGPFELLDQEGKRFTGEDMKGGYSLVCVHLELRTSMLIEMWPPTHRLHFTFSGLFRLFALSRHMPRRIR